MADSNGRTRSDEIALCDQIYHHHTGSLRSSCVMLAVMQ